MDDLAAAGTDAGADRPFGFEHQDLMTGLRERTGDGEPHDACADHDTLGVVVHGGPCQGLRLSRRSRARLSILLEPCQGPLTRRIEPVHIGDSPLDRPEIPLIVCMAQVIAESANGVPRNLRLVHLGQCTQLDRRLGNIKKAHPDRVVDDTLVRQHALEPTT